MVGLRGATSRSKGCFALTVLAGVYTAAVSGQPDSLLESTAERRLEEEEYVCEVRT